LLTAAVTRTFVQGFGVLFAIFVAVFVLPTPFVRDPGPLDPGLREGLFVSGMRWLATAPAIGAMGLLAALGLWFAYGRRQLGIARGLLALTVIAGLACVISPMAFSSWESWFELQKSLGPAA